MSHTPGPWTVETPAAGGGGYCREGSRMIFGSGNHVATVPVEDAADGANAHLIAAAPDLLEALNRLVILNHDAAHGRRTTGWIAAWRAAHLAIIKAAPSAEGQPVGR